MILNGKHPGVVREYDRPGRRCRVEIVGINTGAEEFPWAEISYPVGDQSTDTEARILLGMPVWLSFFGGDPRYPIIDGSRCVNDGNEVGLRHWSHENIKTDADETQQHTAGKTYLIEAGEAITLKVGDTTMVINSTSVTVTSTNATIDVTTLTVNGASTFNGPVNVEGADVTVSGGDVKADTISLKGHDHGGVQRGAGNTDPPNP